MTQSTYALILFVICAVFVTSCDRPESFFTANRASADRDDEKQRDSVSDASPKKHREQGQADSCALYPRRVTVFKTSGIFQMPESISEVFVELWGAGGGGACCTGSAWPGTKGGDSRFGDFVRAEGGKGGSASGGGIGGIASNGDINFSGSRGGYLLGGGSPRGGASQLVFPNEAFVFGYTPQLFDGNFPGGGGAGGPALNFGLTLYGGGGGAYAAKMVFDLNDDSIPVEVGKKGSGGIANPFNRGGDGADGLVLIWLCGQTGQSTPQP